MSASKDKGIGARQAELLARQLNTAFANACGYGHKHPMTEKALGMAHESLTQALATEPVLTLLVDRGSLFVEKHPVGERFNPQRLIKVFGQVGIESVTFDAGVTADDIQVFMGILADSESFENVGAAEDLLRRNQVEAIRFNYIVYRKMTSDQKVVGGQAAGKATDDLSVPQASSLPLAGARVLNQLDSFMSLGEIAGEPELAAEDLASTVANTDKETRERLITHLRSLAEDIESGESASIHSLSSEDLLTAMNTLRRRVKKSLSAHQDVDRILTEEESVISEVDQLTYSTLVTLVREEYRSGSFTARRMAQIINRMLPDPRDLKRLLPQLKKALVQEGMSLRAYAELVHELSTELRGEHLVRALEQGADDIGLDVDEIVAQIQEDPGEAARLIVMATELRRSAGAEKDQLSSAFSDYFERIESQLSRGGSDENQPLSAEAVGEQLRRVQLELIAEIQRQNLDRESADRLQESIGQRIEQTMDASRIDLLASVLGRNEGMSATLVIDWIEQQALTPADMDRLRGPISQLMQSRGYSTDQVAGMLMQIDQRLAGRNMQKEFPATVLSNTNTALFLKREVMSAQRYETPFSVVKISIEFLAGRDGERERPTNAQMDMILPELYFRIVRQARDLDLVGSLEKSRRAVPLLILPMTDEVGAEIVCQRIESMFREFPFYLDDRECFLETTITGVGYRIADELDFKGFIEQVNQLHDERRNPDEDSRDISQSA